MVDGLAGAGRWEKADGGDEIARRAADHADIAAGLLAHLVERPVVEKERVVAEADRRDVDRFVRGKAVKRRHDVPRGEQAGDIDSAAEELILHHADVYHDTGDSVQTRG